MFRLYQELHDFGNKIYRQEQCKNNDICKDIMWYKNHKIRYKNKVSAKMCKVCTKTKMKSKSVETWSLYCTGRLRRSRQVKGWRTWDGRLRSHLSPWWPAVPTASTRLTDLSYISTHLRCDCWTVLLELYWAQASLGDAAKMCTYVVGLGPGILCLTSS